MQKLETFYKYRVANIDNISALHDAKVYLSDPKEFNDPFDSVARMIADYPDSFEISNQEFEEIVKEIEKENPGYGFTEPAHEMKVGQNETLKYIAKFKIYCVSGKGNDTLMWVHYADGLRGFCIEFNGKADFLRNVAKVHYESILPTAHNAHKKMLEMSVASARYKGDENHEREKFNKWIDIVSLTKLDCFRYEEEWRMAEAIKGIISYKPQDVSNIIFGELIGDSEKELIKTILKDKYPHIENPKTARIKGSEIIVE